MPSVASVAKQTTFAPNNHFRICSPKPDKLLHRC
jgi:hypothetical protein